MGSLTGKKILICRAREKSLKLGKALRQRGAVLRFFPTFRVDFIEPSREVQISRILNQLPNYQWLIISSVNGLKAFQYALSAHSLSTDSIRHLSVGVVGRKTRELVASAFPEQKISLQAENLQELLGKIDSKAECAALKVLHPTSEQSLQNISLVVPETMELHRIPFYRTIPDTSHSPGELTRLGSQEFDAIVFGSPSSFDYFLKLGMDRLLSHKPAIAVMGATTRRHIEQRGYRVAVTPRQSGTDALCQALENYFEKKATIKQS